MNMDNGKKSFNPGESRELKVLAVLFLAYLLYLFLIGFRPKVAEQFVLESPVAAPAPQADPKKKKEPPKVILHAAFDSQGFPISPPAPFRPAIDDTLAGKAQVLGFLRKRLEGTSPEEILKNFAGKYGRYWQDPASPDFLAKSTEMGGKLTKTAERNRKLVQDMVAFLKSDAGKVVSTTLKENLAKSIQSPARDTLLLGFSAWRTGDLDQAYRLLQQAEAQDPDSPYMQIIAHQGMAFLNMERHGPLEETMRQYRHLAEESHKYISSFRPALEKAGFDPVKLYGRDPFDASNLPTSEQLEKAMENSKYVQFERKFYQTHKRPTGRTSLSQMRGEHIEFMRNRQKGGGR